MRNATASRFRLLIVGACIMRYNLTGKMARAKGLLR